MKFDYYDEASANVVTKIREKRGFKLEDDVYIKSP